MTSLYPEQSSLRFPLNGSSIVVGRDPACDVVLSGAGVSRRHAEISLARLAPTIRDLKSSFGTRVDGTPVETAVLHEGDCIAIGIVQLEVGLAEGMLALHRLSDTVQTQAVRPVPAPEAQKLELFIGRDSASDIRCNHPLVSRYHAALVRNKGGESVIIDRHSANGTFVNGRQIHQAVMHDDDIVQIGPFRFFFKNGALVQTDDSNRVRIEAYDLMVKRGNQTVLRDVSLCVQPGEFVIILGPSGAGKTTLGHALTGRVATAGGQVFMNGMPLRRFAAAYTSSVGFVAQHDLLHPELTVTETFLDQALLRLPRDSVAAERYGRVAEVIDLLDLKTLGSRRVSKLSGGESKRVHLGIELLASPALLFLDEPLAGLDFGLIGRFMELFKRISTRGHTVLLTTHTLEQIDLADRIVFVDRGRVLYQGAPNGLLSAFGVRNVAEIYDKSRNGTLTVNGVAPGGGSDSPAWNGHDTPLPFVKLQTVKAPSPFRQYGALLARYTKVLLRDVRNLTLLVMQVPLICLLLALVYRPGADYLPISFYFCVVVSAIWVGGVNGIREIAREWEIFERDVRAGLRPSAYACAKLTVFGVLAFAQAALFAILLRVCFVHFDLRFETFALLAAATFGGTVFGLAISTLSPRVSVAVSWLPVLFIPQVFFSGILIPFDRMTLIGEWLSWATIARPVFSLFKRVYILSQSALSGPEWGALAALCTVLCILILTGLRIHDLKRR